MEHLTQLLQQYSTVEENVSLSTMTTLRVGGLAHYVVYPKTEIALMEMLERLHKENIPVKLIGKGSNLLASDDYYEGVCIRLDRTLTDVYFEDTTCVVQAGASIIALSHNAMSHSLSGLEFACGIPGTVAGAVYMNAGAYKSCIYDVISEIYVLRNNKCEWVSREEITWGYRYSTFQEHSDWVILAVRIQLTFKDQNEIRTMMDTRRQRRIEAQPLDYPSAGSIFRNPSEHYAWEYIEGCKLRGLQIGGAMVSNKHANWIINVDHAKASDVKELITKVQEEVMKLYEVQLRPEIEFFNWKSK